MKNALLAVLAEHWEDEAKEPTFEDGSPGATHRNAVAQGRREGLRECADTIRQLISIIKD